MCVGKAFLASVVPIGDRRACQLWVSAVSLKAKRRLVVMDDLNSIAETGKRLDEKLSGDLRSGRYKQADLLYALVYAVVLENTRVFEERTKSSDEVGIDEEQEKLKADLLEAGERSAPFLLPVSIY